MTIRCCLAALLAASTLFLPVSAAAAETVNPEPTAAAAPEGTTPPASLRELLDRVRTTAQREARRAEDRERQFLEARDRQQQLLDEMRAARRAADAEADRLQQIYTTGEERLGELETALAESSGDLDELFSIVRQAATDVRALVGDSLVSAERDGRLDIVEALAEPERVPDADDLREFWLVLLDEMEGSGNVSRFEAPVIGDGGEERLQTVTRIGTFTAVSEGRYLRYLPDTGRLLALASGPRTTPPGRTRAFEAAEEPILPIAIDPSRGTILALMVQAPDLEDRVRQGGVIGYVIIALGVLGLLVACERGVRLGRAKHLLDDALEGRGEHDDLAALQDAAADKELQANPDGLAARFDEIVTAASRRLHRGVATLSIIAAVSPLLGLLGTVTGMIETFQIITLFGAGDPRLMSGGISQALVTTQLGLCVAIPLLLLHSFVQGRANLIVGLLDERSARLFAQTHPDRQVRAADDGATAGTVAP